MGRRIGPQVFLFSTTSPDLCRASRPNKLRLDLRFGVHALCHRPNIDCYLEAESPQHPRLVKEPSYDFIRSLWSGADHTIAARDYARNEAHSGQRTRVAFIAWRRS